MLQNALRNKMSELQSKRSSPRKRAAAPDTNDDGNKDANLGKPSQKKLYVPPQKRKNNQQNVEEEDDEKEKKPMRKSPEKKKAKAESEEKENSANSTKRITGVQVKVEEKKAELPPLPKFDYSMFDSFANRSWVDIIDEEEEKQRELELQLKQLEEKEASVEQPERQKEAEQKEIKKEATDGDQKPNIGITDVEMVSSLKPKTEQSTSAPTTPDRALESDGTTPSKYTPKPKEGWATPKTGWCTDEKTVERRDKELQKMKIRPTYRRYLSQIPKFARKKDGTHPRTPNKYINHTRRSWDKQVRLWKLAIYEWAGETPTSSVAGSECSDEDLLNRSMTPPSTGPSTPKRIKMEDVMDGEEETFHKREELRTRQDVSIALVNPDAMASMFGHFDMDTLRGEPTLVGGEESTLKAAPSSAGPTTEGWAQPKTGWCMDVKVEERREKELQKIKAHPAYKRYTSQIPKSARKKDGTHPWTPNKYHNHTSLAWNKQVKLWKLAVYEWAGETPTSSMAKTECIDEELPNRDG